MRNDYLPAVPLSSSTRKQNANAGCLRKLNVPSTYDQCPPFESETGRVWKTTNPKAAKKHNKEEEEKRDGVGLFGRTRRAKRRKGGGMEQGVVRHSPGKEPTKKSCGRL